MNSKLPTLIEKFFLNLKADITKKENALIVTNVPANFEKFYGKKSPYEFVFDKTHKTQTNELIENSHFLLKTISNFLDNSGKTTLLKIQFNFDKENIKNKIKLNNCQIEKLIPKKKHNFFFRFTFHTTFQYLNEKEKMINEIYIYNNEIINGNLSNYNIIEGSTKEVILPEIKEPYTLAKEKLKELINPKTISISQELSKKLDKEINRINSHFEIVKQELHTKNPDQKTTQEKQEELNLDKQRELDIEKQRHSLNLGTKLFNTTLIYYPVFTYDCFLKNHKNKRIIELSFDPLLEKTKEIFCESCKQKTPEIFFCSSGHISCKNCFTKCESCTQPYCKKCVKTICTECNKKICKNCSIRCFSCGNTICKTHATKDKISGRYFCRKCLKSCERCGMLKEPINFKISKKTNNEICEDCFRREMQENVKSIFRN
ncbi:MAG: hypothetical protein OQK82_01735 [Candidatus Pacearchaeota archaeon]|nr:hypothetical protein [Candidatus Pacearchaeota archaeon]